MIRENYLTLLIYAGMILFAILAALFFTLIGEAQEPAISVNPAEDFQIKWGTGSALSITPISYQFMIGAVGQQKIFDVLGNHVWETETPDSIPTALKKIRFTLAINAIPSAYKLWWGATYTVNLRLRAMISGQETIGDWSDWSDPVYVISFKPAKPVHQ